MESSGSFSFVQIKEEKEDEEASLYVVEGLDYGTIKQESIFNEGLIDETIKQESMYDDGLIEGIIKEEIQWEDEGLIDAAICEKLVQKMELPDHFMKVENQFEVENEDEDVGEKEIESASFDYVDCLREIGTPRQYNGVCVNFTNKINNTSRCKQKPLDYSKVNYLDLINESFDMIVNERNSNKGHLKARHYCIYCNRDYKSSSNLKTHLILHTSARPYACKICSCRFKQKVHLKFHTMRHTGEKPYICRFCPASFIQKSSMKVHEKAKHGGEVSSSVIYESSNKPSCGRPKCVT